VASVEPSATATATAAVTAPPIIHRNPPRPVPTDKVAPKRVPKAG
jgi:hypothetical protein